MDRVPHLLWPIRKMRRETSAWIGILCFRKIPPRFQLHANGDIIPTRWSEKSSLSEALAFEQTKISRGSDDCAKTTLIGAFYHVSTTLVTLSLPLQQSEFGQGRKPSTRVAQSAKKYSSSALPTLAKREERHRASAFFFDWAEATRKTSITTQLNSVVRA